MAAFWFVILGMAVGALLSEVRRRPVASRDRDRYRGIAEGCGFILIRSDASGRAIFASDAFCGAVQRSREDLIGHPIPEIIPSDVRKPFARAVARLQSGQSRWSFETLFPVNGDNRWHLWMIDRDSTTDELQFVGVDIQDRKAAEEELQRQAHDLITAKEVMEKHAAELAMTSEDLHEANQVAESATRAKSAFLANMSHEIRTPMTAILGYAELLDDETLADGDRKSHVATIRRNGEHLLSIINDILDLSKIEAGKMEVEQIPVATPEIVPDVLDLMRVRAEGKGLELRAEFDYPLPRELRTDPVRIRQILVNLVGNAIKFSERGEVVVSTAYTAPLLSFRISDQGIGMTEAQRSRLFMAFGQADVSTTRKYGGTGLGLAISKRLAELLGGDLSVESEPGRGTTFSLSVAAEVCEGGEWLDGPSEVAKEPREPVEASLTTELAGRVLLAEDGPDNQRLIGFILRKAGLRVEVAENGRLALEALEAADASGDPFDLIVMDMQMPELDGYAATGELRQRGHELPVIALTAHAMSGDRERCLQAGCTDYTTKPLDRSVFLDLVARHLVAWRLTTV